MILRDFARAFRVFNGQMDQSAQQNRENQINNDVDAVELEDITLRGSEHEREQIVFPPADGGYRAWLLLAGCFIINVMIWGKTHFPLYFPQAD